MLTPSRPNLFLFYLSIRTHQAVHLPSSWQCGNRIAFSTSVFNFWDFSPTFEMIIILSVCPISPIVNIFAMTSFVYTSFDYLIHCIICALSLVVMQMACNILSDQIQYVFILIKIFCSYNSISSLNNSFGKYRFLGAFPSFFSLNSCQLISSTHSMPNAQILYAQLIWARNDEKL